MCHLQEGNPIGREQEAAAAIHEKGGRVRMH